MVIVMEIKMEMEMEMEMEMLFPFHLAGYKVRGTFPVQME